MLLYELIQNCKKNCSNKIKFYTFKIAQNIFIHMHFYIELYGNLFLLLHKHFLQLCINSSRIHIIGFLLLMKKFSNVPVLIIK